MDYTNWLGQTLNVGDIVYYGARQGNTSTYRVGNILLFKDVYDKYSGSLVRTDARVKWFGEDGSWHRVTGPSTLNANKLALIDENTLGPQAKQVLDSL